MTSVWDRNEARISYQVPVGIVDLSEKRMLCMSSVNLSCGGIFVDTSQPMEIGSEVVCNLPVDRGVHPMQVRGKVAWLRPDKGDQHRPAGMGIKFVELSAANSEELNELVQTRDPFQTLSDDQNHDVYVRVHGLAPIRGTARLSTAGIFFRAPLGFLSPETELDFAFCDKPGANYRARVVAVHPPGAQSDAVENGIEVEVELIAVGVPIAVPQDADTERVEGSAFPIPSLVEFEDSGSEIIDVSEFEEPAIDLETTVAASVSPAIAKVSEPELSVPTRAEESFFANETAEVRDEYEDVIVLTAKMRPSASDASIGTGYSEEGEGRTNSQRVWWMSAAVVLVVLGALAVGLQSSDAPKVPSAAVLEISEAQSKRDRVRALIEGPEPVAPAPLPEVTASPNPEPPVTAEPVAAIAATAAPLPEVPVSQPVPANPSVPAPKIAQKKPGTFEQLGGLDIRENETGLHLRLPVKGTFDKARVYPLADPPGLAINLPYATPRSGFQNTLEPKNPNIRRVWIRERLGGIHFRAIFHDKPNCKVDMKKSAIHIDCEQ